MLGCPLLLWVSVSPAIRADTSTFALYLKGHVRNPSSAETCMLKGAKSGEAEGLGGRVLEQGLCLGGEAGAGVWSPHWSICYMDIKALPSSEISYNWIEPDVSTWLWVGSSSAVSEWMGVLSMSYLWVLSLGQDDSKPFEMPLASLP